MTSSGYHLILVTAASSSEAEDIARNLLQKKLIACANLVPGLTSLYWWEGRVEQSPEVLLLLKAPQANWAAIETAIKHLHSYSVPEIIALPLQQGNPQYFNWIEQVTVTASSSGKALEP